MTQQAVKQSHLKQNGFALIATISVMVLLVMIALAMLTLSSIEVRQTNQNSHQQVAQANARMSLMIALGELQKTAGPDQRVTAEAAILEEASDSATALPNRHWVGVWRSDAFKGDPSIANATERLIHRNTDSSGFLAGSLIDRRAEEGIYHAEDQSLTWLVSQADTGSIDPSQSLAGQGVAADDIIRIVGPGSTSITTEEVVATRIAVQDDGKEAGGYAWWVGDEGVKARFDLASSAAGLTPSQPWLTPAQQGINIIEGYENYETVADPELEKSATRHTTDLVAASPDPNDPNAARTARLKNFHDITVSSIGLPVDTQNGGLRKDLSPFLASGSAPALGSRQGLDASTPLLDSSKLRDLSPRFGLFHHWNEQASQAASSRGVDPTPPKNLSNGVAWGWNNNAVVSSSGIDLSQQDMAPIHPVIIDAGISYGASLKKTNDPPVDGKSTYYLNIHYFPRVVLWNPYNVKIKSAKYAVQINMPRLFHVQITKQGQPIGRIDIFHPNPYYNNLNHNLYQRPIFSLSATSFEPGEALLFTADTGASSNGSYSWGGTGNMAGATNLNDFRLSADQAPPFKNNFYFNANDINSSTGKIQLSDEDLEMDNFEYAIGADQDGFRKLYFYKLYLDKGGTSAVSAVHSNTSAFPPLQYISQTEDGSEGSDAPWFVDIPASVTAPLREVDDLRGVTAFYRFKWGHRIQWLTDTVENQNIRPGSYNTPYLGYNVIANHNMRAGWHVPSPVEVRYRASASAGRYTQGIAIDDPYGWDWTDSSLNPVPMGGKNRVSPFGRPAQFGGQTFPILDLPRAGSPLVSLAAFQHAPLSQFVWHPTYAVGNSLADPRVPRNQSTHFVSASDWNKVGVHNLVADNWEKIRQGHVSSELNDAAFLYDLSYEANFALWDSYFLSTVPQDSSYTPGDPLPNPRMIVSPSTGNATTSELQDFHKSAKHVLIKGAFNINSTSEKAWASLFASLRENPSMSITLEDGSTMEANDVYSRFLNPYDQKYDQQGALDTETWKGYRQLDDDQIRDLAREVVREVKQRGPFISLADFVNRRLVEPPSRSGSETAHTLTGLKGTLQAAIDRTTINATQRSTHVIPKTEYSLEGPFAIYQQITYGAQYPEIATPLTNGWPNGWLPLGPKPDHNHWADSKLVGAPSYLTQADMLQKFGSILSARSDTFVIRAYGDSVDAQGKVKARAWCEAIVQRVQDPIIPDEFDLDPDPNLAANPTAAFGRRFKIQSFRWLNPDEI